MRAVLHGRFPGQRQTTTAAKIRSGARGLSTARASSESHHTRVEPPRKSVCCRDVICEPGRLRLPPDSVGEGKRGQPDPASANETPVVCHTPRCGGPHLWAKWRASVRLGPPPPFPMWLSSGFLVSLLLRLAQPVCCLDTMASGAQLWCAFGLPPLCPQSAPREHGDGAQTGLGGGI